MRSIVSFALLVSLSACAVEAAGYAGIGVGSEGELVGNIQMCGHHVDGATLYETGGTDEQTKGSWTSNTSVTDFAAWPLEAPTAGWTATQELVAAECDRELALYGWTEDNRWPAAHVTFRLSDLASLEPGQVLHMSDGKAVIHTEAEFRSTACSN